MNFNNKYDKLAFDSLFYLRKLRSGKWIERWIAIWALIGNTYFMENLKNLNNKKDI